MDFVIDNSIVMSWCFNDQRSDYADTVLDSLTSLTALAPSIWPLEVGNVLLVAERRKRLRIFVEQESPERILKEVFALARSNHLSSYDASYLDLAMSKGGPIASLDQNLVQAIRNIRIPIFSH